MDHTYLNKCRWNI